MLEINTIAKSLLFCKRNIIDGDSLLDESSHTYKNFRISMRK